MPPFIAQAGPKARTRFVEFFTAQIRNPNTRAAYARAIARFCAWCEGRGIRLRKLKPVAIAAYVEELGTTVSVPTVKQHLAAIKVLCDWLVLGQVLPMSPAACVRGPRYVVKRGKTPILTPQEARRLLDSIGTDSVVGLRDRALIGVMLFAFARVSATTGMRVGDYRKVGDRRNLRLFEKGGKRHEVPVHRELAQYLDRYLAMARLPSHGPLFPSLLGRTGKFKERAMSRGDALRMIKRRAGPLGLEIGCHSFRGTGITAYLAGGGTIEKAQAIAAHESPQTTKLYDRTRDELTVAELERVRI